MWNCSSHSLCRFSLLVLVHLSIRRENKYSANKIVVAKQYLSICFVTQRFTSTRTNHTGNDFPIHFWLTICNQKRFVSRLPREGLHSHSHFKFYYYSTFLSALFLAPRPCMLAAATKRFGIHYSAMERWSSLSLGQVYMVLAYISQFIWMSYKCVRSTHLVHGARKAARRNSNAILHIDAGNHIVTTSQQINYTLRSRLLDDFTCHRRRRSYTCIGQMYVHLKLHSI